MLVGIVGTHGLPASYSGWETLVQNLFHRRVKVEYLIATPRSRIHEQSSVEQANSLYVSLKASGWQSLFYDALSMWHMRKRVEVILVLGVSGCWFLPFFKLFFNGMIITNTDGIEYRREKWGFVASNILRFSEYLAVKFSDRLIADNPGIESYINNKYQKSVDSVIAYGGIESEIDIELYHEKYKLKTKSFDLAIARIVPENNIEAILETYSKLTYPLLFIGNWDSSEYSRSIKGKVWSKNIQILPADYNQHRISSLRKACRFYIHGHSAGGTNPSLVEALSLGCRILSYNVNFNKYVINEFGSYWSNSDELLKLIKEPMKNKMKESDIQSYYWRQYSWDLIIDSYEKLLLK